MYIFTIINDLIYKILILNNALSQFMYMKYESGNLYGKKQLGSDIMIKKFVEPEFKKKDYVL